jgi:predicted GIY-YIG superfamily endonuclease
MDNWWLNIIEKKTGLYVGITIDSENRMRKHRQPAFLYQGIFLLYIGSLF